MQTDPIADFLTQIRNAVHARSRKVDIPASQIKLSITDILKTQGFIRNYKLFRQDGKGILRIYLKYAGKNTPVLQGIQRLSKPSRRVYRGYRKLPKVLSGLGVSILSTPKGVITDKVARENKVGGEILCTVW